MKGIATMILVPIVLLVLTSGLGIPVALDIIDEQTPIFSVNDPIELFGENIREVFAPDKEDWATDRITERLREANSIADENEKEELEATARKRCLDYNGIWHDGETSCMPCPTNAQCVQLCQPGCEIKPAECTSGQDCETDLPEPSVPSECGVANVCPVIYCVDYPCPIRTCEGGKCVYTEPEEVHYCKGLINNDSVCLTLWDPVCAYDTAGNSKTHSNSCNACRLRNVYYIKGECTKN